MGRRWSPEQIARRLLVDFPDDEATRISHEGIYQALFVHLVSRADSRFANRAGIAGAKGTHAQAWQNLHLSKLGAVRSGTRVPFRNGSRAAANVLHLP